jgi:hypothetical protein
MVSPSVTPTTSHRSESDAPLSIAESSEGTGSIGVPLVTGCELPATSTIEGGDGSERSSSSAPHPDTDRVTPANRQIVDRTLAGMAPCCPTGGEQRRFA